MPPTPTSAWLEWGKDVKVRWFSRFCLWCLEKGEKGGEKLQAKAGRGLYWALLLFVGIPLPGTGAWTGTLAASFLDMDFKKSVLAVVGGVILASIIVGVGKYMAFVHHLVIMIKNLIKQEKEFILQLLCLLEVLG